MCRKSWRQIAAEAAVVLAALLTALWLYGCRNAGTYAVVGDIFSPVDLSDGSDTVTVRAGFSLTGAKVWSARDSKATMTYTNAYTNCYFGVVEKTGRQDFHVEVAPLAVGGEEESAPQE